MNLSKPPWADEVAKGWQQKTMWLLFAMMVGGEILMAIRAFEKRSLGAIFEDGGPPGWFLLSGGLYVCLVTLHIARRGRAPSGWLPW